MNTRLRVTVLSCAVAVTACGQQHPAGAFLPREISSAIRPDSGVERIIHTFRATKRGIEPLTGPIAGDNGVMFGSTYLGGTGTCGNSGGGCGTIYQMTPDADGFAEHVIYDFKGRGDGVEPRGMIRYGGNLYGVTFWRSEYGALPVLFELVPNKKRYAERTLYQFPSPLQPNGVTLTRNGVLYITDDSSAVTYGSIVRVDLTRKNPTAKTIFTFPSLASGAGPRSPLAVDSSGTLYGTTSQGGTGGASECLGYGCGTIFKLTPSKSGFTETVLYDFQGTNDGAFPNPPILDSSGTLYLSMGLTEGSACVDGGCGTVGSFNLATRKLKNFYYFTRSGLWWPNSYLTFDRSGALYGTTSNSGYQLNNDGGVFKLTRHKGGFTEGTAYTFTGTPDGAFPGGGLLLSPSGTKLYGVTRWGGTGYGGGDGVVFSITI
jgi:uncharacterized repeat protein (TIGR03803 family)